MPKLAFPTLRPGVSRPPVALLFSAALLAGACGSKTNAAADGGSMPPPPPEPACGDGHLDPGEICDDHNTAGGDGCSARCTWDVQAVAGGESHSCGLIGDGRVKCWGDARNGMLGVPEGTGGLPPMLPAIDFGAGRKVTRISAGAGFTCALFDDGAVRCWGIAGALGRPASTDAVPPAVDLGTGRTAAWIDAGPAHVCAVLDDQSIKCWGGNQTGQLGLGDNRTRTGEPADMGDNLPAVDLGAGKKATRVVAGTNHTCALLVGGAVKCWGLNIDGQLGLGDIKTRGSAAGTMGDALPALDLGTGRTAVAVAAAAHHSCAILDDGGIKCWGKNSSGALGIGLQNHGSGPGEMGDHLPAMNLGAGRKARMLVANNVHSCAILDDGSLRCWGSGGEGQLGLGAMGAPTGPQQDQLPPVDLGAGRKATYVDAGQDHTCVVLDDGAPKCWGWNQIGVLGWATPLIGQIWGDEAGETGDATPELDLLSEP